MAADKGRVKEAKIGNNKKMFQITIKPPQSTLHSMRHTYTLTHTHIHTVTHTQTH